MDELAADEIDDLLRSELVGRIGCHAGGRTYVVPVIYAYDDGCLYVVSVEGRKIHMMRANPEVCFEVDRYEVSTGSWRSAIAEGRFEELDGGDVQRTLSLLAERFRAVRDPAEQGERRPRGDG